MSDELESDGLEEAVDEIVEAALSEADRLDRMPWYYMGFAVFCLADGALQGNPIALRPDEIIGVRPGGRGRCGLTLRGREKTVIVYGEFMDCLDAAAGLQPPGELVEITMQSYDPVLPPRV